MSCIGNIQLTILIYLENLVYSFCDRFEFSCGIVRSIVEKKKTVFWIIRRGALIENTEKYDDGAVSIVGSSNMNHNF